MIIKTKQDVLWWPAYHLSDNQLQRIRSTAPTVSNREPRYIVREYGLIFPHTIIWHIDRVVLVLKHMPWRQRNIEVKIHIFLTSAPHGSGHLQNLLTLTTEGSWVIYQVFMNKCQYFRFKYSLNAIRYNTINFMTTSNGTMIITSIIKHTLA
jgi:hypothetical protein